MNTTAFFEALNQKLEKEREVWGLPGISYGVVKDGETAAEGFIGQKDIQSEEEPDRETLYQIGSVTKSFTAAGIALLAQRKQLSFQDQAVRYLPWLRIGNDSLTKLVTIADLLCHRTGMGRHDEEWIFADYSRRELVELLGTWEPDWPFRTHWEYQNLCYVALGLVIESVSGMAWEEFIKKEFLEPLCMKQTGFFLEELAEYPNHAEPYGRPQADKNRGMISVPWFLFPKENKKSGTHAPHGPAGSIYSNVSDMEKWLNFQLGLYPERAQTILKKEFLAEMHRPQMQMESSLYLKCPEQTEFSYGYGWFRSKYRGITLLDHGGNVPGYGCLAVLVPELKLGITAHINLCDTTFAYALAYEIIDHELGISGGDWFARQWNYMENRNQKEEIRNGSETM